MVEQTTDRCVKPQLTYGKHLHERPFGILMYSNLILINKTINISCYFLTHSIQITQPLDKS
jgi:hypothetical protein